MQKVHFILKDWAGEPKAVLDFLKVEANGGTELFMPKWGGWMPIPYPIKENRNSIPFYHTGIDNCNIYSTKYFCLDVELTPEMVANFWEWYDVQVLPVVNFKWVGNSQPFVVSGRTKEEVAPYFQQLEDKAAKQNGCQPIMVDIDDIQQIK